MTATLAALGRQAGTTRLGLAGLTESDVAELIRLTEGVEASGALVEAVHDETEGNPLFVGEVVRLLAQEGLLEGGREEVKRMGVPGGVREVIGRRLSHLSEKCRQVLTFAAILGREFDLAAVEQVSGVSLHELLEMLDEAMTARVVIEVAWNHRTSALRPRADPRHDLRGAHARTADRPPPLGRRGARGVVRA